MGSDLSFCYEHEKDMRHEKEQEELSAKIQDYRKAWMESRAEVDRLKGLIAEANRILEDSEPDDVDIYRVQCALEGKEW
jgi:predicted RNase H-like nuclease (RuvC/YqgF family)